MSVQESKLKAIADAIRYAENSASPIPAPAFPERIRALKSGSGGNTGGFDVLENWAAELNQFTGYVKLSGRSISPHTVEYEVLEGV